MFERGIKEPEEGNDQLRNPKRKTIRIRIFRYLSRLFSLESSFRLANIDHLIKKHIKKIYVIFR